MGLFEAFEKSYSSIVKALFPKSMSEIGDIEDLSTQMVSRVDAAFKKVSLRMSEIDENMKRLTASMKAFDASMAAVKASKYEEPVCAHETVEVALRLR